MTKGYARDMAEGRDIKNGYRTFEGVNLSVDNCNIRIYYLIRNENSSVAGIILKHVDKSDNNTMYLCIPHPNSERDIKDRAWVAYYNLMFPGVSNDRSMAEVHFLYDALSYSINTGFIK